MSPRTFDRFMLHVHVASHPKFSRLTDSEFRATIAGVFPLAAMSPIRGRLLIADQPIEAEDVAHHARVPVKVAQSAMEKLRRVGVIVADEDLDCERVHDFEDWNPTPKVDRTAAERQARYRERLRTVGNGVSHAVTHDEVTPTEVEGEVEVNPPSLQGAVGEGKESLLFVVKRLFAYWQEQCNHPQALLSAERRRKCEARLKDGYTEERCRLAIDGAARAPHVDERGVTFDDFELIFRNASKLDSFIARASAVPTGSQQRKETSLEEADRLAAKTDRMLAERESA